MARIALVLVSVLLSFAACGGPARPPAEPPPTDEVDACAAAPSVAATRVARDFSTGCMSSESMTAYGAACTEGDPVGCDRWVGCQLGGELSAEAITTARAALRTACDGGIAEACRLRVGLLTENGQPMPADGCADIIRGCQLGDESSCFDCGNHCR